MDAADLAIISSIKDLLDSKATIYRVARQETEDGSKRVFQVVKQNVECRCDPLNTTIQEMAEDSTRIPRVVFTFLVDYSGVNLIIQPDDEILITDRNSNMSLSEPHVGNRFRAVKTEEIRTGYNWSQTVEAVRLDGSKLGSS